MLRGIHGVPGIPSDYQSYSEPVFRSLRCCRASSAYLRIIPWLWIWIAVLAGLGPELGYSDLKS